MTLLSYLPPIAGLACYAILLSLLLRGHVSSYLVLFLNVLVLLLTGVVDAAGYFHRADVGFQLGGVALFYVNDLIRQTMVYVLVISLVYKALTGQPERSWIGRWFILVAAFLAALFLVAAYVASPTIGWMMTSAARNLSVTAMVMNLILWALLARARNADRRLLLVTGGLGIQMAGEAMGQSLRLISRSLVPYGNTVLVASHLLCLAVWISAFRRPGTGGPATRHGVTV